MSEEIKALTEEEALEAEAARLDAKRADRLKAQKLAIIRARLEGEALGEEGYHWAVVPTGEGVVLVKRVEAVVSKVWRDRVMGDSPLTPRHAFEYTAPGVVIPDEKTYKAWCNDNDSVSTEVANALTTIYRAAEELRKKGP